MNSSSAWIPLSKRSQDIQNKVQDIYELYADQKVFLEALDAYESEDWGLIPDGLLYRGLIECQRQQRLISASEIRKLKSSKGNNTKSEEEIFEDEGIEVVTPVSDELGQPLKWFRANPPNSDIKNQAEDEFRIRLLDLYIAHVSKTGETYFPPLEEKLRTRADFFEE